MASQGLNGRRWDAMVRGPRRASDSTIWNSTLTWHLYWTITGFQRVSKWNLNLCDDDFICFPQCENLIYPLARWYDYLRTHDGHSQRVLWFLLNRRTDWKILVILLLPNKFTFLEMRKSLGCVVYIYIYQIHISEKLPDKRKPHSSNFTVFIIFDLSVRGMNFMVVSPMPPILTAK